MEICNLGVAASKARDLKRATELIAMAEPLLREMAALENHDRDWANYADEGVKLIKEGKRLQDNKFF